MNINKIFDKNKVAISYEFFPPKSEKASEKLFENIQKLMPFGPAYVSVTYGAGGTTRDLTHDLIVKIQKETNLTVVSHLTCVGSSKAEIGTILDRYNENGITNILALRGDPPKGQEDFQQHPDGFEYAADLVKFIKQRHPHMGVGVAGFPEGHPACPNRLKEMEYLKAKVDAGADYICTQLFFDNRDFYDFKERCELAGIKIPIIAGVMPVNTLKGLKRMSELALGARIPAKLMRAISRAADDEAIAQIGIHWATEQVRDLIDNQVDGVHFYTLNQSTATLEIYKSLGISESTQLQQEESFL